MAELADAVHQSRSRLTHTVTRMEKRGLIERTTCPVDRRGVWANLTDAGQPLLEDAAPSHVECVRRNFVDAVDPADYAAVGRAMRADPRAHRRPEPDRSARRHYASGTIMSSSAALLVAPGDGDVPEPPARPGRRARPSRRRRGAGHLDARPGALLLRRLALPGRPAGRRPARATSTSCSPCWTRPVRRDPRDHPRRRHLVRRATPSAPVWWSTSAGTSPRSARSTRRPGPRGSSPASCSPPCRPPPRRTGCGSGPTRRRTTAARSAG